MLNESFQILFRSFYLISIILRVHQREQVIIELVGELGHDLVLQRGIQTPISLFRTCEDLRANF
jgi:hypothetical protein